MGTLTLLLYTTSILQPVFRAVFYNNTAGTKEQDVPSVFHPSFTHLISYQSSAAILADE